MAKQDYSWIGYVLVVGMILLAIHYGWFSSITNYFNQTNPNTPFPGAIQKEYLTYNLYLDISPNDACVGDLVTGTITSNIYNGMCSVFMDTGVGYGLWGNVNLNANGYVSASQRVIAVGSANIVAVCCDRNGNCRISNTERLTMRACDTDGDGIPDELDPDDDNDGFSDEDEIAAGTDPKDLNDYPGKGEANQCNIDCIAWGYLSGRGPFTSGSFCSYPEVIKYMTGESGLICCCAPKPAPIICFDSDSALSPFELQLKTAGYCTDKTASYTDHCYESSNSLIEYYCSPTSVPQSEKSCDYVSYNCPGMIPGSHCDSATGRCVI